MEVAHKNRGAAEQPLTHSHKHIYILSAHTHAHGWHTGCLESKAIFPGSPFSRPSPWQLTDTAHSTIPPRVSTASAVRGACVCVWAALTLNSAGLPNWSQGRLFKSVYAQISDTQTHTHITDTVKPSPSGASSGRPWPTHLSVLPLVCFLGWDHWWVSLPCCILTVKD